MRTINCKGKLIDLSTPKVMGILNITPDSFYDGGKYEKEQDILEHVDKMITEGATFIDVGGYSSRPGAKHISEEEELERVVPVIEMIQKHFPDSIMSIDTFRSNVAKAGIQAGAAIVNDISAGQLDEDMLPTVGKLNVPYIMMHMRGTPQTMKEHTNYKDLVHDVNMYFSERINNARYYGVKDIILDPGFGFSKNLGQNFELLNKLELLTMAGLPLLVGVSRKSMIFKLLDQSQNEALNGTTSLNTVALMKGASILRVHDVKEAMECVMLYNQLNA
ncbi:MAG: dihydropteroate synthase [Bacteroidia bacterium]|nr:dihydropteroate synthase [Bacteroidia bacterium]NND11896.1 dihydropteroate synthase [Flavobacteriaceae bacterium]NNK28528.1 dihydropteroate synthase [Flavobacteriaceae bacterium]RZV67418.1 MAG: dihydropteroate synthase [Flavobacteriaceae bacterium]